MGGLRGLPSFHQPYQHMPQHHTSPPLHPCLIFTIIWAALPSPQDPGYLMSTSGGKRRSLRMLRCIKFQILIHDSSPQRHLFGSTEECDCAARMCPGHKSGL